MIDAPIYHSTGEPCLRYGVSLPGPMQGFGTAGRTVDYTLSITNTGTVTDYYDLSVSSNWQADVAPAGPYPVGPGESIQVVISITIPDDANPLDIDTSVVTSTSLRDPTIMSTAQITTSVGYRTIMPLVMKN